MARIGKAVLQRELDGQYTLMVYLRNETDPEQRFRLQSSTPNLTLTAAFNAARDALGPLPVGGEMHEEVTIQTVIALPAP